MQNVENIIVPRYEVLVEEDPVVAELFEEAHYGAYSRIKGKFTGIIIEGEEYQRSLLDTHTILSVYPPSAASPDSIKGFFAFREIKLPNDKRNIIKSGSLGYIDKSYLPAIIREAMLYLYTQYPPETHSIVVGFHKSNEKIIQMLESVGGASIESVDSLEMMLLDMGQLGQKKIFEDQFGAYYISEKGDEKRLFVCAPRIL